MLFLRSLNEEKNIMAKKFYHLKTPCAKGLEIMDYQSKNGNLRGGKPLFTCV